MENKLKLCINMLHTDSICWPNLTMVSAVVVNALLVTMSVAGNLNRKITPGELVSCFHHVIEFGLTHHTRI